MDFLSVWFVLESLMVFANPAYRPAKMKMKNLADYDTVKFKSDIRQTLTGLRVGKWLAVVTRVEGGHKIYRVDNGSPIIQTIFTHQKDAITFAEWLVDKFGEFFDVWEEYPDVDLFSLVKWTIEDGLRLYETIKELDENEHRIDSLRAVNDAYFRVEDDAKEWNRLGSN